jgi:hypothetical protein
MLGSIKTKNGYSFNTYAPGAKVVQLNADGKTYDMTHKEGYWHADVEGLETGKIYSYMIDGVRKCDPYAHKVIEINKYNPESVTYNSTYTFKHTRVKKPLTLIYEVYLRKVEGATYQEKAHTILKACEGYSHVQIMPFNYTPNKKTLGYKTSTYFAPEHKYGSLDDLKEMIDILHQHDVAVILDFSIFEFEEFSNTGLKMYDGTALFERSDRKQHPIFTGFYFDISKLFVREFLKDVVKFLIHDLNADGIRIDGVNEVVFINKGETQDINEEGLAFFKDVLNEVPSDRTIIADMLTHHKLKDLDLDRIDAVEANMFMFQVQKILMQGKEWFEKNKEYEIKLLNDTIQLLFNNKYIGTINHDIHINGIDNDVKFGKLKTEKDFEFIKKLISALPVAKQIYFDAVVDKEYINFIDSIKFSEFSYAIYENGSIHFTYQMVDRKIDLLFNLFETSIELYQTTRKNIL